MDNGLKETLIALNSLWKLKLFTIAGVKLTLGSALVALCILLFAAKLSRLVVKIINKRLILPFVGDKGSQITYQTFAFYASLAGFISLSLTIAGIPLTVFTVLGGALAIGVGFGSQNIVNNFISGVIILIEQPIRVGDIVEVDGITGAVSAINTRSTKIRNVDNKVFIVPNSFFLEKGVVNWSFEDPIIRAIVEFGVSYGTDVKKVSEICMEILMASPDIEKKPLPLVNFTNFADSSLTFEMVFFCDIDRVPSLNQVKSDVRFKLEEKFRESKISMPFPQRDMNLRVDKPISVKVVS
jgi:potassium efflux system protein